MWSVFGLHKTAARKGEAATNKIDGPPNSSQLYQNNQVFSSHVTAATSPQENAFAEKGDIDETVLLCCARLLREIVPCQAWFLIADAITGREIDIQASFARASCRVVIFKFIEWGLSLLILLYSWMDMKYPEWFFAYGSNGSLVLASLYFMTSLYNSGMAVVAVLFYMPQRRQEQQQSQRVINWQIRMAWILFEMAAHCEVVATILFWVFNYTPSQNQSISLVQFMSHAGVAVLVWVDGLYVNRIPVRLMHWYGCILPLDTAFVIWTAIQSYAGAINPYTGKTYIYAELDWQKDWVQALVSSLVLVLVLGPLVFLMLWMFSLYQVPCCCYKDRRCYLKDYSIKGEEEQHLIDERC